MKNIFMIVFLASSLCVFLAYGEAAKKDSAVVSVNESLYSKETIPVDNAYACQVGYVSACEVPVLLDKTTGKIAYYWSAADNGWIAASYQQAALQALYDKREEIRTKRQLKAMQDEMDRRNRESMEEGQRNTPSHR